MRTCLLLAATLCAALIAPVRAAPEPTGKPEAAKDAAAASVRALLICGGCCHDYTTQKDLLTKGISERAKVKIEWTVVQEGTTREHKPSVYANPEWWKGYDVILHDECYGAVTDVPLIEGIVKAHDAGVPAVNLHCAVHSYRNAKTDAWVEMLGIRSMKHGPKKPIAVTFTAKDHPITKGLVDWSTGDDELYNNIKVYDTVKPLATGKQGNAEAVVAWTNDYKGTRVFCTTLGHGNDTVGDDRYLDLVTNGFLWALNKLDDAQPAAAPVEPASSGEKPAAAAR
jgi:type 1 glutamine amidotransferase